MSTPPISRPTGAAPANGQVFKPTEQKGGLDPARLAQIEKLKRKMSKHPQSSPLYARKIPRDQRAASMGNAYWIPRINKEAAARKEKREAKKRRAESAEPLAEQDRAPLESLPDSGTRLLNPEDGDDPFTDVDLEEPAAQSPPTAPSSESSLPNTSLILPPKSKGRHDHHLTLAIDLPPRSNSAPPPSEYTSLSSAFQSQYSGQTNPSDTPSSPLLHLEENRESWKVKAARLLVRCWRSCCH